MGGYHFGLLKLEVKTKTETGVEFTTGGNSNMETGKVAGNLETKYQVKDLGMTLTEKWTTDNSLNTTIDVVDKLVPGLKVSLDTKFAPGTGAKSGALKTEYKHDAAMLTADLDLGLTALNATAVMGHKGWLAGYQTSFDLGKSAVTKSKFGLGAKYVLEDGAVVRAKVNNNSEVGLGYQQKLRDGVTVTLSTLINGANFNAGGHKVGVSLEMSA